MIRSLFFFLCLLLSLTSGMAQDIKWGPAIKTKGKTIFAKTLLLPNQDLLLVQLKKNVWKQRWDTELTKISSEKLNVRRNVTVPMEYSKNNLDYQDIYVVNGKTLLFSTFYNKVKKTKYLYVNELSERSFTKRPLIRLAEVKKTISQSAEFIIKFSPDSSKIGIVSLERMKDEVPVLNMTLLDSNLSYLYVESLPLETTANFTISQIELSDSGEFFIMAESPKGRSVFDKSIVNAHSILHINALGHLENSLLLDYESQYASDLSFKLNDEYLLIGGLFSEVSAISTKGVIYQKYKIENFEEVQSSFDYFDYETLISQLSMRGTKKASRAYDEIGMEGLPELKNIKIREMIVRSDLGLVILAEQSEDYVEYDNRRASSFSPYYGYRYDPFYSSSNKTYHHHIFNDIFVININSSGEIDWTSRIPKLQHTINDRAYYSSYTNFTIKDRIGVIFNDNSNNMGKSEKPKSYAGSNGVGILASVFVDGKQDREIVNLPQGGMQIIPKASHQIDSDKLLLVGRGGGHLKIAILKL